jgi:hypothetical protein
MKFRSTLLLLAGVSALLHIAVAQADPALNDPGYFPYVETPAALHGLPPKHLYVFGSPYKWNGTLTWRYNDAGRPASLSKAEVVSGIAAAARQWMATCNVSIAQSTSSPDTTTPAQNINSGPSSPNENVIGWGDLSTPPAGGANIAGVTFTSSSGGALVDADTTFSIGWVTSAASLKRVAVHELGHAIGLAHSNVQGQVMSGPASSNNPGVPATSYNGLSDLQPDDIQGCLCLYGPSAGNVGKGYICSLPTYRDFGSVPVGNDSAKQSVVVKNASTSGNLTINAITFSGSGFRRLAGCEPDTTLAPGTSCTLDIVFSPSGATASRAAFVQIDAGDFGPYAFPVTGNAVAGTVGAAVNVIEYYNADLDHYFISGSSADINALDTGAIKGWTRTGQTFRAYPLPQAGTSPVCRFYLPPINGNSHFYSASPTECADVHRRFPTFDLESSAVMHVALPDVDTGECPVGWAPVYRVWNARTDSNHRYTTEKSIRDDMVAAGGIAEGYGADMVIMCAAP